MALPLPRRQSDLLAGSPNLSLHFDHGYAGYDPKWAHRKADPRYGVIEGRTEFLRTFVARFNDPNEYGPFLGRRDAALELRSAKSAEATSSAPLLVGLGRWNPTEIGFNLDRFTGCPFIPGSSVKGLLREAARLVAAQELPEPQKDAVDYWKGRRMKTFGRDTSDMPDAVADEAGSVVFFDAYPIAWPRLELDVMTPHYGGYYGGNNAVAADWEDPVPVHFLRVPARTTIRFWFAGRPDAGVDAGDLDRIRELLPIALDWLGLGAKTSSGYGWFGRPVAGLGAERTDAIPTPKVPTPKRLEWPAALLQYERGSGMLYAVHGNLKAYAKGKDLEALVPADLLTRLKDKKLKQDLTATVIVEEFSSDRRIVEVRSTER